MPDPNSLRGSARHGGKDFHPLPILGQCVGAIFYSTCFVLLFYSTCFFFCYYIVTVYLGKELREYASAAVLAGRDPWDIVECIRYGRPSM